MIKRATAGFSLIELLVAVSIFVIISLTVLANHSRFNSSVLLGSLAYDIALSIREAQIYGLSVRQFNSNFQIGYGIHFSDPGSYVFFVDQNADRAYSESDDEIVREYTLGRGHSIMSFCGTGPAIEHCSDTAAITHLDVVFFRPDPDAIMSSDIFEGYSGAEIVISSRSGEVRTVRVASTGQISVQNP